MSRTEAEYQGVRRFWLEEKDKNQKLDQEIIKLKAENYDLKEKLENITEGIEKLVYVINKQNEVSHDSNFQASVS